MADDEGTAAVESVETCTECGKLLSPGDRVEAGGKAFCSSCHAMLREQLTTAVRAMSEDINYPSAAFGAVLCGLGGVLVWWGVTVVTHWSLGIVAVGVGWAAGWGTLRFSGGKRSRSLQMLSAGVAAGCWVLASYLVSMTFINEYYAKSNDAFRGAFPPQSLEMIVEVMKSGFGIMDVVFLAIMVWEAWKFPRPIALPQGPAA
jgi:Flp pilus assembly protein TadB